MSKERYPYQVALLLQVLPLLNEQDVFALKGGTAINLFIRDMPRLSVDIDLTYLPLEGRDSSITGISRALISLSNRISSTIHRSRIQRVPGTISGDSTASLIVSTSEATIKIEANTVLRGSVFPCSIRTLCNAAQQQFSAYAEVSTLSLGDLFGGKLCAVLDRQHPRDLFDARLLP